LVVRSVLLAAVLCLAATPSALAQTWTSPDAQAEPWNNATLKLGPFFVAPNFNVKDVGVDNNVFRDDRDPKVDLTATIAVSTIFGFHSHAFSLGLTQDNNYIWFRRYTQERSIDSGLKALAELRLQHIRPWIIWSKAKSHDRAGFEIDERAGREIPMYEAGSDFSLGDRTGLTVAFSNQRLSYDEGAQFDGVELAKTLDNKSGFVHVNGRWQYSDFTDLIGGVEFTHSTFPNDPLRNADTVAYLGGFQSHGDAPIAGRLQVGYKVQHHQDPIVPDFRGLVAGGAVTTVVADRLKLELTGDRDLAYSYDDKFPFYVQQGGGLTATGRLSARFDIIGAARAEWMRYDRAIIQDVVLSDRRTDRSTTASLGFLYTMGGGDGSHFGLSYEASDRVSPITAKNYRNHRILTNIKFSF
jgi:hypothetical protein